jgi:hypothetical protein
MINGKEVFVCSIHFMKLLVRPVNSDFLSAVSEYQDQERKKTHEERICRCMFSSAVTLFVCVI